jgi:SAM-dependent methyltransferase
MHLSRAKAAPSFDRAYYKRFYLEPRTAVSTRGEMRTRARLIAATTAHAGLPVRRVLELGCGTGMLRAALIRLLPRAQYVALEYSEYLCQRYGWQQGSVEDYRASAPFDLVVCYDVLQYLPAAAAERALTNFARLCRGMLYFAALTRFDYDHNCDRSRTDSAVYLRSARWYRTRLNRHFHEAGLGFWLRRGAPLTLWELESL